jgi:enoyl-CoA hydratase/carnithine racemase
MTFESLVVEERGAALVATINREKARNALNGQVMRELFEAIRIGAENVEVRAIVITGAGDRSFCAGRDLGDPGDNQGGAISQHFDRSVISKLFLAMRSCAKPLIARVNGHALGGGFGLALACDLIVATDEAEFGTPEINIGLWPYVITSVISRNVPQKVALEMMMLGKRMSAAEAQNWGFVNRVVPSEKLDEEVDALVEDLSSKSPAILRLGKESFYNAQDLGFEKALKYLESQLSIGLQAEDVLEGVSAFFQKRKPDWKGR